MEPITHLLTGACIGRAGLNRKSAYATLAAVLAAEAADLDVLWSLGGPVEELKHHRGITHTFLGAPFVAGAVVGAVWLLDLWLRKRKVHSANALNQKIKAPPAPALNWLWLYATALIAALSHLLLDWTNNYGLRPFFPFNPRWYAGSFVFIVEPVLLAILALALFMPWVLGLADGEIGARRQPFRGRGWAIFALAGMVVFWGVRWTGQMVARSLIDHTQVATAPLTRVALEPYPVNPFRWHAILETADYYQTAEIDSLAGSIDSDTRADVLYKPARTAATEAARQTFLGQVYLDWGAWAVVRDVGQEPIDGIPPPDLPHGRAWTTVQFTDLRFAYSFLNMGNTNARTPLGGRVYIVDGRDDAGEAMGGREQR
jgi:inner membrane protein